MNNYESGYDPKYGFNRNDFAYGTPVTNALGKVVKGIVVPLGLVREAVYHKKDKNRRSSVASTNSIEGEDYDLAHVTLPVDQADELIASGHAAPADGETATHVLVSGEEEEFNQDEEDWALDDAASELDPLSYEDAQVDDINAPTSTEIGVPEAQISKLPFPVVVPQRRPGTKSRGFVRAYAPVLNHSGINQDQFLNFLKDLHKSSQASPIFDVVLLASAIAGFVPHPVVYLPALAIQIAAGVGKETQERWRTNKFLDKANKQIFIPKGLYVLIVAYQAGDKTTTQVQSRTVDLGASAFVKYGQALMPVLSNGSESRGRTERFRVASARNHGEAEMPVHCASLIFPALDAIATSAHENTNDNAASSLLTKSRSASKFVNDYMDRRAQATYAGKNPNSTLTQQVSPIAPEFKSRFADPNNATNFHFFTLITGGKFKAKPLGARRRYERAQRKAAKEAASRSLDPDAASDQPKSNKRFLQEDVLYLMVVNMPTKEELEKAKLELQSRSRH